MCGIVGYIGERQAYDVLIKGLYRLEYRGYDSAGLCLMPQQGVLNCYKTRGKVAELERYAQDKDKSGTLGIAHTRWATHGEPNDINAHPHYSQSGDLAMIHNGIIENYLTLRTKLEQEGYQFRSTTDSEVVVNLIEYIRNTMGLDLCSSVQHALNQVVGAYAIAIVDKNDPDLLIGARKSSPLVVGVGDDEYFLASDATPIVEYTNKVVYLQDGQIVLLRRGEEMKIVDLANAVVTPEIHELSLNLSELEKGGYPHFMLKEIYEQSRTIQDCIRGRVNQSGTEVVMSGVSLNREHFLAARRIIFVACGTSWHAALIGKQMIEEFCRIPVDVEYASEFRYRNPVINPDDIVIAISQSGETADTLAAVELAKQRGAFVYGICNVVGSSIARATHSGSYIHVGPEVGVASTKAFTGQVTTLAMMTITIAKERGTITPERYVEMIKAVQSLPEKMNIVLKQREKIEELSKIFTYANNFIYLGRGYNYPAALEGALKLKEISYIHAEGYPAAEMKHGPIALIDAEMPVVAIATSDSIYGKSISNIQEIKARSGRILALVSEGDNQIKDIVDYVIEVPEIDEFLVPILTSIPLQLLAYFIAVNKRRDVDRPRNLAKSVPVE
ncbi:MAG: glutamine--fructose-6-phosphate transaminase (isomerizing) [Rikenellaceae bacterium]|nr:glutamine--fructose-6-phosphate transaminase (isomerizing) [Rikenellaceae bacterium]